VVADEVRSLAERTRQATVEIRQLVEESNERTSQMQTVITTSGERLTTIAQAIRDVSSRITRIADSTASQATQITSLTEAVARIDAGMQTNAATAEESASVAASLRQQADRLSTLVGQFKVREPSARATETDGLATAAAPGHPPADEHRAARGA
jgi:methyl-accepting chemotaxis protein